MGGRGFHPAGAEHSERMIENNIPFRIPWPCLFLKLIVHRVSVRGPCVSLINQYPMLEIHAEDPWIEVAPIKPMHRGLEWMRRELRGACTCLLLACPLHMMLLGRVSPLLYWVALPKTPFCCASFSMRGPSSRMERRWGWGVTRHSILADMLGINFKEWKKVLTSHLYPHSCWSPLCE